MEHQSNSTTKDASVLRDLRFTTLDEAVSEARQLLESGYVQHGNWTLGQVCWHLRRVQDPSIDGYPWFFGLFAFLRPIVRRTLMPRILRGDSPRGIRTAPIFVPANELDDNAEVEAFQKSVDRFLEHQGSFHPHPGFGRLDRTTLHLIHAAHAAHHLRFLQPSENARIG